MEKEFLLNTEGNHLFNRIPPSFLNLDGGVEIVYFINLLRFGKEVIVPGVVKSETYKTQYGKSAVKVELIEKGSKLETEVRNLLKDKGYVNFW